MKRGFLVLCALIAGAAGPTGAAIASGDPQVGATLVAACAACHGESGDKPILNYPIIAGQHEDYLLRSMLAYQSGSRNNQIMSAQMAPFSREDLENIAAYFATQPSPLH